MYTLVSVCEGVCVCACVDVGMREREKREGERERERLYTHTHTHHYKCCCDGECCMYAMQAGLQFGQKAQYVHVCRWFDQALNILCAMRKVRIENPLVVCVCVCVCTLWYHTIPLP